VAVVGRLPGDFPATSRVWPLTKVKMGAARQHQQ
jgi:hypothetical protein